MPWYKKLHWQIIIAMIAGLIYGLIASSMGWVKFTTYWIKPWGTIFINLLKFIAIPMILSSLIVGVASLSDLSKLSRIGGKTIGIYLVTTVIAITLGLLLVNILKPGKTFPKAMSEKLQKLYINKVETSKQTAIKEKQAGPLQPLINIVPQNAVKAASENKKMLQVVFIALMIGIGMVNAGKKKSDALKKFFVSLNDVIMCIIDIIMKIAPLGVFAQISATITDLAGKNPADALLILKALGYYMIVVLLGLFIHTVGTYGGMLQLFTSMGMKKFFNAIRPAQLIGFSTSSSAATLPVTMECCEKDLDVPEEICSFTLPVGATINMDGTSLYQAVTAVFIAQILGRDLSIAQQIVIVLTCTLSSIGTAGVPGAGVVMLVIVLQAINIPVEGIALVLGVERLIDMFRTVTNITGDAVVTTIIAESESKSKNNSTNSQTVKKDNE